MSRLSDDVGGILSEDELRALVRAAIAQHHERSTGLSPVAGAAEYAASWQSHASHGRFPVLRGGDDDGACLIEPTVRCNHCGYCQSYGH
jgi:hypothetical protein